MGLRNLIVACTLLVMCSADQTFTTVNSMLDPNRICWWRTKWAAAPILLSINNRSKTSVSVTFFISPTTSLTAGVLEVTFPTGFTLPTIGAVSGQVYTLGAQTYVGGQDYAVSITGITNPSTVGAYGPFALRTRYNAGGQQVDVNLSFGCVYIYGDAGTLGAMSVQLAGTTINNIINKSGNTLSFRFTIAVSLWRYDTFVINLDSRWTIASGATCSSADYSGRWNNFNGTNTANPHALQCVVVPKTTAVPAQVAYIYGLAVDGIDLTATADNQYVDLRITSVTTPDAVYVGHPYSWTVSTYRFGTATMLESNTVTSAPVVANDVIATATWAPTWGLATSELVTGTIYFMDLSFTITNALPASSAIDITVSENPSTTDTNWVSGANCYVVTYLSKSVACTVTSSNIQLSGLPALAAGSSIKIRNLVTISTTAGNSGKITSIKTYQGSVSGNVLVDVGTNLASFTVTSSTTGSALTVGTHFGLAFVDATTAAANVAYDKAGGIGGTGNKQGIQFWVVMPSVTDFATGATATFHCPFTSAIDDFGIGVPSNTVSYKADGTGVMISFAASSAAAAAGSATLTPSSTSASHGTFVVTSSVATTPNAGVHLLVAPGTSGAITLPRVINNLATAYECRIKIEKTGVTTIYRNAVRFAITAQTLGTATLNFPCKDIIEGMPAIITYLPNVSLGTQASATGTTYYVEFSFATSAGTIAAGFSSGFSTAAAGTADLLSYGTDYPVASSVSGVTARMYVNSGTFVAVTGLPALTSASTSTPTVVFPIGGGFSAGTLTLTIKTYYVLTADPRYQFVSHTDNTATFVTAAAAGAALKSNGTAAPVSVGTTGTIINSETASGWTIDVIYPTSPAGLASKWIYFIFPVGYTWSSTRSIRNILTSGGTYTTAYFFSSTFSAFAYPGALIDTVITGSTSTDIGTTGATAGTFTIVGFILPRGKPGSNPTMKMVAGSSTLTNACNASGTVALTPSAGLITGLTVSPTTVKQRGPDGINIKHTVSFSLPHGVALGGSINMGIGPEWGIVTGCSRCTATGLTNASTSSVVTCTLGTNSLSITGFADVASTTAVSVSIDILGLLAPTSITTTGTGTNFVTSLNSKTSDSLTIDEITALSGTAVSVTATSVIGATTWTTKKTYPMNAGSTAADLYLKFSLPHALPKCGVIQLTSPLTWKLSGTTVKNSCFLSPVQYSDCSLSGSTLSITLDTDYTAGGILELYLDAAVDNPSSTTTTTTGFSILASWGGITVDQDSATVQTSQQFTATALLTSTITPSTTAGLAFAPKTAGEVSTYTFDFKDSVNFAVGDQYWIVFPPQYDYFLGDVWTWLTNESNVYYIECSSTQLGTTWCSVDHNIVVVTGSNAITGSTQIVINIQNVVNPAAAQTSAFQIYHVNANGDFLTVNQNYGTVTPTAFAGNLDVRSLDQTDRRIFKSSDMKWRLYISDTMNTDSQLKVLFPREYDLSKFDKKDSYSCSSTWFDNSASATIKTQQNWNSASSCTASGNWITLANPTTSITFTANNIVTWTVQSVGNPQWGQSRSALTTTADFDVTDSVLWPLDPMWASKFTFFVYRSSSTNLAYTTRSYPNMNAAYAGFYQGYRSIIVNGYGPQSKTNRIVVYAGTQTQDLYIATAGATLPLAAKQIVFTPTTNSRTPDSGKLKYTSAVDSWILFQSWWRIQFRVAAGIDMVKGLYYIDWSNNETKQSGLNDVQYDIPVSTLVEVIAKKAGQYVFSVSTIPNVSTGYTSVPIKISIKNAPHTDCTVNISVSGTPANISITPTAVTFSPDVNEKYFQIQVASNYDLTLGTVQTLLFTLTGTDAYAFSIVSSLKFTITQSSTTIVPGNVVSWGLTQPSKTSITAAPSSDQTGVIYYQLAAAGTAVPSFSSLKSSVTSLVGSNTTNSSPGVEEGSQNESDPQTGETWIDFQRRIYKTHLEETWTGVISMYATTAVTTLTFNWLFAGTTYQISGYLDNLSSSTTDPTVRTETFTTTAVADCQPFAVKFQGLVAQSFSSKISQEAANAQGVNPLRLYNPTYATSTSRALQGTGTTTDTVAFSTFTYTLLPNRFSESPSPADQAKIAGTSLTSFTAALKAAGITNSLNSVANGAVPSRVTPQWTASPSSGGSTTNSVTVTLRSNVAGQSCCVALTGTTTAPTPEQVMLGLDSTNTATTGTCITSDLTGTTNSVQVSNLQAGTTYYVYCSATDSYPMWPTQMAYSTTNPMTPVSITTLSTGGTVTSSASYFGGLFLLLAFLLH